MSEEKKLQPGVKGKAETTVTEDKLASTVGSGSVPVFSTPSLILLIESAAVNSLEGLLKPEDTSVGTEINVKHIAATPLGLKVWAEATVREVEGRKIKFDVVAFDEKEKIGEGTHERCLVNKDRFEKKAQEKKA